MTDSFQDQMEENAALLQRLAPSPVTRRRVLVGGGATALGLVAAACGTEDDPFVLQDDPDPDLIPAPADDDGSGEEEEGRSAEQPSGDVATAMLAASLEVLAVDTYQAALDAAGDGSLPDVPEAVATFVTTAQGHHVAHRDAWNDLLTTLGETEVTEPPPELAADINEAFGRAGDIVAVAELALRLEQTAADTYFEAIPTIENGEALALAASIQPIDMQHAAILRYVLGQYPVPETFASAQNSAI